MTLFEPTQNRNYFNKAKKNELNSEDGMVFNILLNILSINSKTLGWFNLLYFLTGETESKSKISVCKITSPNRTGKKK